MPDHEEEEEDAQGGDAPADNLTFIAGGNNIDASAQHEIRPRLNLEQPSTRSRLDFMLNQLPLDYIDKQAELMTVYKND